MMHSDTSRLELFYRVVTSEGFWRDAESLQRYLEFFLGDVSFPGKNILDIGGGDGLFSLYAATQGARRVVCLEPEADGCTAGVRERLSGMAATTGVSGITLRSETLQEFMPSPGTRFDVVIMHNSVNHLDEQACMSLQENESARARYRSLFVKLARLTLPGGALLLSDASRHNLFPLLGLRHPISRTIEWHKHQSPGTWGALLSECGFEAPQVTWSAYNRMGPVGWRLFANSIGAFLLSSHFRLRMRRLGTATVGRTKEAR
jgi:2-polyprenyl-3-methyl-5-hydroxy-6-metoxy-1,4-benzoquinol methylase